MPLEVKGAQNALQLIKPNCFNRFLDSWLIALWSAQIIWFWGLEPLITYLKQLKTLKTNLERNWLKVLIENIKSSNIKGFKEI